mmetsp:Transcript_18405/g.35834  ORF Transcript_18405/g.35834 Transcript_18405/m.35834 type:complete len:264 (-) Transcript_18405:80-871(-)|eukprot:CAMPEP_0171328536 /NCGR_PEP_ID=MMETSP0878-20121228/716_1 /TAXON_ID=67004 /ORGANISM="Thalassiosira weissflogii, Strain CCMP1336" /LENGTH=263 /DNA_ID=CAMNT_0011828393 /DNA_START=43 /DNA_END=834 /DNA_ORIENTATION=+
MPYSSLKPLNSLSLRALRGKASATQFSSHGRCYHIENSILPTSTLNHENKISQPVSSGLQFPSSPLLPSKSLTHKHYYSSSSVMTAGMFGWVREKFEEREKGKQAAKLVDQIALMANAETWTLKMFADEVDETLSSWRSKIPGMGGTRQIKTAKETQKVAKAMMEHFGGDATAEDIANLDRKQKLKLSIASEMPLDDVNVILDQFRNMEIMHRILRYRKVNGKPLPTDEAGLKMAMQQDGIKVMTNQEKKAMREAYAKKQGNA